MELQADDAGRAVETLLAIAAFGQIFRMMRKIDNDGNTRRGPAGPVRVRWNSSAPAAARIRVTGAANLLACGTSI